MAVRTAELGPFRQHPSADYIPRVAAWETVTAAWTPILLPPKSWPLSECVVKTGSGTEAGGSTQILRRLQERRSAFGCVAAAWQEKDL